MDAAARAQRRFMRQDYDKQVIQNAGPASSDYSDAGPPSWNRASWDAFHRQFGFYPFSAMELPPTFAGCPDWAYELMGLRKPGVTVAPGGAF